MERFEHLLKKTLCAALIFLCGVAFAGDDEAAKVYSEGHELYQKREFYEAAKKFEKSEILAESPAIKANSLVARIGAWRMCKMIRRELECINTLLDRYPEYSDYKNLSDRIYEIGDRYYAGEREPSFWHLRWIPFLNDGDKTIEIYQKALERAPFAPAAARTRLRLAYLLDKEGKVKDSIVQLREIVKNYPKSPEYRYGILALAEELFILSEKGDGDGTIIKEAYEMLKLYQEKFPDTSEMEWVRLRILRYQDAQAKRLCDMAEYYTKNKREDAARRYLANVLSEYPKSELAPEAEKRLIELDPSFTPGDFTEPADSRLPKLKAYKMPHEASRILITPATDHNAHFLQPVPDLKGPETSRTEGTEK